MLQVFDEIVARDSDAGAEKWHPSSWNDNWSGCSNEHAFKVSENDHQKQRSRQSGNPQCTRQQHQVRTL